MRAVAAQFVGVQETQTLLTRMETGFGDLVREASKSAPLPRLAEVLRRLLDERVSIANMRTILEAVAEWAPREQNTAVVAEHVRTALRRQICHGLLDTQGRLSVVLIEGALDDALRGAVHATPSGTHLALDRVTVERLLGALRPLLDAAVAEGARPAVLASPDRRRPLRALLARHGLNVSVLSHPELATGFGVHAASTLRHGQVAPSQGRPHLAAVAAE